MTDRLDLLLGLWRGDDLSAGYATTQLALEVALIDEPGSARELGQLLSDDVKWPEYHHKDVVQMVDNAFARYQYICAAEEEHS